MSVPYPVHFRPDPAKHNSDPYQQLAGFFSDVFSAIYRHDTQMFIARRHRGEGILTIPEGFQKQPLLLGLSSYHTNIQGLR